MLPPYRAITLIHFRLSAIFIVGASDAPSEMKCFYPDYKFLRMGLEFGFMLIEQTYKPKAS
jgi:hypothetical protein